MALAMATAVLTASSPAPYATATTSCSRGASNASFMPSNLGNRRLKQGRPTWNLKKSDGGSGLGFRRDRRGLGVCVAALQKLDEVVAVDLTSAEGEREIPAAAGVYAVYDREGQLQFMGISRRVSASVQTHLQDLPNLCGSVKVALVDAPEKSALSDAWRLWIQEYVEATGQVPPGNQTGVTTWTARKARAVKPELKLTPGPHKELNIPLTELIDKVVKEIPVVAFIKGTRTAPQCGFSHRVLTILIENGVDFEVVNVLDEHYNPGIREAIKTYSQWPTIPQVYVRGEFVGGADIVSELAESGQIKAVFNK